MKELMTGKLVGGGVTVVTITAADAVLLPATLLAVSTKVVLATGTIMVLPEEPTGPIPLSMVTDVAFVTFQLKVTELPRPMLDGLALK
jgi:hypothetical protein